MTLGKMIKNLLQFIIKTVFSNITLSSLGACTFRTMTVHQGSLRPAYDTLSLTNSTLVTADTILWYAKNPVPN